MERDELRTILRQVAAGTLDPQEAARLLNPDHDADREPAAAGPPHEWGPLFLGRL